MAIVGPILTPLMPVSASPMTEAIRLSIAALNSKRLDRFGRIWIIVLRAICATRMYGITLARSDNRHYKHSRGRQSG